MCQAHETARLFDPPGRCCGFAAVGPVARRSTVCRTASGLTVSSSGIAARRAAANAWSATLSADAES